MPRMFKIPKWETQLAVIMPLPHGFLLPVPSVSCTVPSLPPTNTHIHTLHGVFRALLWQCLQRRKTSLTSPSKVTCPPGSSQALGTTGIPGVSKLEHSPSVQHHLKTISISSMRPGAT